MESLVTAQPPVDDLAGLSPTDLARWYAAERPVWRSNLVVSLDGRFTDRAGSSRGLSGDADLLVLRVLRAISDVVVVGGSTARQEGYVPGRLHPDVEALASHPPRLAVLTTSLAFDPGSPLFSGHAPPLVITDARTVSTADHSIITWLEQAAHMLVCPTAVTGAWVRSELEGAGLARAVVEGGPVIQGMFRDDDAVDEVDLTVAPCIVGTGPDVAALGSQSETLRPVAVGQSGDHTFLRLTCLH